MTIQDAYRWLRLSPHACFLSLPETSNVTAIKIQELREIFPVRNYKGQQGIFITNNFTGPITGEPVNSSDRPPFPTRSRQKSLTTIDDGDTQITWDDSGKIVNLLHQRTYYNDWSRAGHIINGHLLSVEKIASGTLRQSWSTPNNAAALQWQCLPGGWSMYSASTDNVEIELPDLRPLVQHQIHFTSPVHTGWPNQPCQNLIVRDASGGTGWQVMATSPQQFLQLTDQANILLQPDEVVLWQAWNGNTRLAPVVIEPALGPLDKAPPLTKWHLPAGVVCEVCAHNESAHTLHLHECWGRETALSIGMERHRLSPHQMLTIHMTY